MKIVIDDKIPYIENVFEGIADTLFMSGTEISNTAVRDADALIVRTRTKCNRELLEESSVKFIATATIGFDHIDTDFCSKSGIAWTNAPGCNAYSVQQYIISSLLNIFPDPLNTLPNLTIGIVGLGNVGSKIYDMASAFNMNILLNDPPLLDNAEDQQLLKSKFSQGEFTDIEEVAVRADIVTFHTPLIMSGKYKTYHMGDASFFSMLKKDAVVINSSRGEVVDNRILKDLLRQKALCGAVLDVWENEPYVDEELLNGVIFGTPHIAGYSADGKANGTAMSVQAVSRYFGLGLDDWTPDAVPPPENPVIKISESGRSDSDLLREIFNCSYNINLDSVSLKSDSSRFEYLRGNYPLRREPPAYTVLMPASFAGRKIVDILQALRFNVEFFR